MPDIFTQEYRARWADMDFNQHMRNGAFLGCSEETRMRYLDVHGWTMDEFMKLRIGPVVVEDRLAYSREALCAVVESVIVWVDLDARKAVVPPTELRDLWLALARTEDFASFGA